MTDAWPERVQAALAKPVDIAWLGGFRALFGVTMCISMVRYVAYGWIDAFFVGPTFHFKYYGFGWLEPLPRLGMHAVFWSLAVLAFLIAIGQWFRLAACLFVLGFGYLQLVDVTTYLNHYYLATLLAFLLALSPADRWGSVRTWRDPASALTHVPCAWHVLFRFQVAVVYTFAGLAKAHGDWLAHAQPLRIWLASLTDLPLLGPLFTLEQGPLLMSWAGFLFDTFIIWFLLWPRMRLVAYAMVIVFHTLTRTLFPIGMFSAIMVVSALVFFSPSWPRKLLSSLASLVSRYDGPASASNRSESAPARGLPGWALLGLLAYCLVQLAMPLRFLAYGGNVRWHEQGMRFSWRVMVREKNGSVTFQVTQKGSGRRWYVSPHQYLTRLQEREMSSQPDLVLQLAHHIHDDFVKRGLGPVEVRADAMASLNGRRRRRLIDPDVDLARVEDSLARASWILPAPSEAPPHLKPI
jgi:vitamin K-dependent gamma-carboxylase